MRDKIREYFESVGIEYFAVLDYRDLVETSAAIVERSGFVPGSAVVYLVPYYTGVPDNISRYAASLDYHIFLREVGEGLIALLKQSSPNLQAHAYGDHSPINECHAALVGGLGVIGDNGLIINERYGSYVFIGDVITDLPPEVLGASLLQPILRCDRCGACKRSCPTGILRGEGSDCLSAVTQRKGELSAHEVDMIRKYNTAWGCDICQSVCPHNKNAAQTPIDFFRRDRIQHLTSEMVEGMDKAEFRKRAFAWRGKSPLLRNLDILEEGTGEKDG